MRVYLAALTLVVTFLAVSPAQAKSTTWSSDTALTLPKGRWEIGLFHGAHWGVHRDVQLSVSPVAFFILPHLEAKVRWFHTARWHLATKHRLSCPTVFLKIFAREGDLGLLPANTKVPVAFGIDTDVLVTAEWWAGQLVTLKAGIVFAPRLTDGSDLPLLDFPFLYNRFAALKTTATGRAGLSFEGQIVRQLAYKVDFEAFLLPVIPGGYTVEVGAVLRWRPSDWFSLSAGCRLSYGRYPVGDRFHYLPFLDVAFAFGGRPKPPVKRPVTRPATKPPPKKRPAPKSR